MMMAKPATDRISMAWYPASSPSWAMLGEAAGPMGPMGLAMPTTIRIRIPVMSTGVRHLPMMSTRRLGRMVRRTTTTKNKMEKGSSPSPSNRGRTAIS